MSAFDPVPAAAVDIKAMRKEFFKGVRADFDQANREIRSERRYFRTLATISTIGALALTTIAYVCLSDLFPDVLPAVPVISDLLVDPPSRTMKMNKLLNATIVFGSGIMAMYFAKVSNDNLKRIPELFNKQSVTSPAYRKKELKTEIRYARDVARQRRFLQRGGYFDTTNINPWQRIPYHEIKSKKFPTVRIVLPPTVQAHAL